MVGAERTTGRELIASYLASFAEGRPDAVVAHVTEDFVNEHLGVLARGCEGKETYRGRLAGFLEGFQNLRYEPIEIVADGSAGAARYCMRFTQSGKDFEINGVMWFKISNGLISKRTDCWDGLVYLQQAGAGADEIAGMLGGR
ncbi:MAG: nuclear transport factor 2 family protein [Pseudomonadota bacterium]